MFDKATLSYVKLPDGKIVNGSESVSQTTAPPDLSYVAKDLKVHNGRSSTTTTNSDGILPGRAYKSIGVKPVVNAVRTKSACRHGWRRRI